GLEDLGVHAMVRPGPGVWGPWSLRHPPLEADAFGLSEHILELVVEAFRYVDRPGHAGEHALQQIAPLLDGPLSKVLAIEPEEIEDDVVMLHAGRHQLLEPRDALRVERHDFAVQYGFRGSKLRQSLSNIRKSAGQVQLVPGLEREAATGKAGDASVSVIFHLKPILVLLDGWLSECGEHRWPNFFEETFRRGMWP